MATLRPAVTISRHDIVVALYHIKTGGRRDLPWPTSRKIALSVATQVLLALGTDHIEDFGDADAETDAEAQVTKLFPELKP